MHCHNYLLWNIPCDILVYLLKKQKKDMYPSKLSREIGHTVTSFSKCLPKLEKMGLIEYPSCSTNRLIKLIKLTEKGKEVAINLIRIR